ncbi:MAG: thioredoxin [Phycisphaerae bacterium]|nr:thioredoxin [Phycisphaerae bacterium]
MWIRVLIGVGIGMLAGSLAGYFGKCNSGTCPLTANPWRGAFFGAFIGVAVALMTTTAGCSGKSSASANANIVQLKTKAEFKTQVLEADKPVLVDFYANWCGPCKRLAPTINQLAGEYENRAEFRKVDGDQAGELMKEYGIRGYPTVLIFKDGKVVKKFVGAHNISVYRAALDAIITITK